MPCLVGVDVGDVRVGLAISDSDKKIAFPLGVVQRVDNSYGFNKIAKLVSGRDVEGFVVGLPVKTDGTLGTQAEKVLAYIDEMKKYFQLQVTSWDERFSTALAERHLKNSSISSKHQKRVVDEVAAQIILQSYLDSIERPQKE